MNVHVYSPAIHMSSVYCTVTCLVLEHLFWREFKAFDAARANQFNSVYVRSTRSHCAWMGRGRMTCGICPTLLHMTGSET